MMGNGMLENKNIKGNVFKNLLIFYLKITARGRSCGLSQIITRKDHYSII